MIQKFYYKLILSYKGTNYSGWQFQTINPNTIQNAFEKVLKSFVNFQDIKVIAASRTDTGVHALGQVLKIVIPKDITPKHLVLGLNSKLPNDIKVISCDYVDSKFNVNRDVLSKEYHYYFCRHKAPNAILAEVVYYHSELLNIHLMHEACKVLIGTHDLSNFCVKGGRDIDPVREIFECSIEKTSFYPLEPEVFYLKIKAKGFLKYSVRLIMSALFDIGKNKIDIEDLKKSLNLETEKSLNPKAPAHGLHLIKIKYKVDHYNDISSICL